MRVLFNRKNVKENIVYPRHIGIIMDGNGRWAKKRGLPRVFGHKAGAKTFRLIAKYCSRIGIEYLTVYAFSTENWNRPESEIKSLMSIFEQHLKNAISDFKDENIRVKFLGEIDKFPESIKKLVLEVESESKKNSGMILNIAMNYGGRREIINAVKVISKKVLENDISLSCITEDLFSKYLYTSDQPDLDLIIRTSGEFRISNFFIWQSAYSEYFATDVFWPDFSTDDLDNILRLYTKRIRRFGGV